MRICAPEICVKGWDLTRLRWAPLSPLVPSGGHPIAARAQALVFYAPKAMAIRCRSSPSGFVTSAICLLPMVPMARKRRPPLAFRKADAPYSRLGVPATPPGSKVRAIKTTKITPE
jgi:hypothetical protein